MGSYFISPNFRFAFTFIAYSSSWVGLMNEYAHVKIQFISDKVISRFS